jgi:D-alanine-D-alanine ligase
MAPRRKAAAKNGASRKRRILALMHESLVPPDEAPAEAVKAAEWKTEYHVVSTLRALGHEVRALGVGGELGVIRAAVEEFQPHIAFNLLEGFDDVPGWDANVIGYLELLKVPYTGCNSRGLLLARDKSLTKKVLSYHRVPVADFAVFPRNRRIQRRSKLKFPLIVKSLTLDASIGISQASVVDDDAKLVERIRFIHESIGTDALVERYIEGRELYVGVLGNQRLQALPVWELYFRELPEDKRNIATERLKWSLAYQKKHGIDSGAAQDLAPEVMARIQESCKRVYRNLLLSGYARIDLRLDASGQAYVIEANPNPQVSPDEDFARSAHAAGTDFGALLDKIVTLGLSWEPTRWG